MSLITLADVCGVKPNAVASWTLFVFSDLWCVDSNLEILEIFVDDAVYFIGLFTNLGPSAYSCFHTAVHLALAEYTLV